MTARSIDASHAQVAAADAASQARDAAWREIDEAAAPKRRPVVVIRRPPAKPVAPRKVKAKPSPAALPPGSLVLSPEEVTALDHLLATHPELNQ